MRKNIKVLAMLGPDPRASSLVVTPNSTIIFVK
jgi:hypothetical protein